jgi:hypothetical protein
MALIASAYSGKAGAGVILFVIFLCLVWYIYRNNEFGLLSIAGRLRELERQINALAGMELLVWEAKYSGIWPESQRRRIKYIVGPIIDGARRAWEWVRLRVSN